MDETFQKLYDEIRRQMLDLEDINKSVNQIVDKNLFSIRVKELLKEKINNIIAEYFILYDIVYQMLEDVDNADTQMILDAYGGENGNI